MNHGCLRGLVLLLGNLGPGAHQPEHRHHVLVIHYEVIRIWVNDIMANQCQRLRLDTAPRQQRGCT